MALSVPGMSALPFSPLALVISHIAGILFMLVAERRLSSRILDANPPTGSDSDTATVTAQDGMELREQLQAEDVSESRTTRVFGPHQRRVYLFSFAFVVAEVAAGVSLGYRATAPPWRPDNPRADRPIRASLLNPAMMFLLLLAGEGVVQFSCADGRRC